MCLLIAGSDLSRSEIRDFFNWIDSIGPQRASALVGQLRDLALGDDVLPSRAQVVRPRENAERPTSAGDREIVEKIEKLLLVEAGLTKTKAIELLARELDREVGSSTPIPDAGRNSFRAWIDRLYREVPSSLLLHVATKIRNELAHAPRTDWPLRKD